jgi:hypothetical protein
MIGAMNLFGNEKNSKNQSKSFADKNKTLIFAVPVPPSLSTMLK